MDASKMFQRLFFHANGFAFDPLSGLSYALSASAMKILHWLREGCGEEEISDRLASIYETSPQVARRDVGDFLSNLRAYRLL